MRRSFCREWVRSTNSSGSVALLIYSDWNWLGGNYHTCVFGPPVSSKVLYWITILTPRHQHLSAQRTSAAFRGLYYRCFGLVFYSSGLLFRWSLTWPLPVCRISSWFEFTNEANEPQVSRPMYFGCLRRVVERQTMSSTDSFAVLFKPGFFPSSLLLVTSYSLVCIGEPLGQSQRFTDVWQWSYRIPNYMACSPYPLAAYPQM